MSTIYPVRIRSTSFREAEQTSSNPSWVRALSSAHLQGVTNCLCTLSSPPQLSVKLYSRDKANAHYGLALWPDSGLSHRPDCRFFTDEDEGGGAVGTRPAFEDIGAGKVRAHLAMSLAVPNGRVGVAKKNEPQRDVSPSASRARANEAALLLKLWRVSGLNVYRGPRKWFSAAFALIHAAKRIVINREGDTLADFLLVASNQYDKLVTEHNAQVLVRVKNKPTRLFVVGRMKPYSQDKQQTLLPLLDSVSLPKILTQVAQLDQLMHGRSLFQNVLADKTGHVVALACIEPSGPQWWKLHSLAGVATDKTMIPVESSYEIEFSNYLAGQNREFLKPVAADESGLAGIRPDFILLDTPNRVYCEVWGMQTPEYLAYKAQKLADFASKKKPLLSWSANPRDPLPTLPAPAMTAA